MNKKSYLKWIDIPWTELPTETDIQEAILIIPIGSIEQHGSHLPLSTDTRIPEGIVERLANHLERRIILGVPIHYTYAPESEIYPGTVSMSGSTLTLMVADILTSYLRHPFGLTMLLNGHMESYQFILEGMRLATKRTSGQSKTTIVNWWDLISDETIEKVFKDKWPGWEAEHAALTETSMALALFPEIVIPSAIPAAETFPSKPYKGYPLDADHKPPSGSFANPSTATAEVGEILIDEVVENLVDIIEGEIPKRS